MNGEYTYKKAGVDLEKIKSTHHVILSLLRDTLRLRSGKIGEVYGGIGHYASLVKVGGDLCVALHVDGVGTKVLIAQLLGRYNTVGIDCVAMCVNDIICVGAEPIAFLDYIAVENQEKVPVAEIVEGIVKGAKEAKVAVVGGETAVMRDVIAGIDGLGFDLVGFSIGIVKKDRVITGESIQPGDVVIGLPSNGLHSNGFTLVRKLLLPKYDLTIYTDILNSALGEELLKPTRIYVSSIMKILGGEIHGLAHITGGAYMKLRRLTKYGFKLKMPPPQPIFKLIQKEGKLSDYEMYRTFNMGIGFCIVAPPEVERNILEELPEAKTLGVVTKDPEIKIESWRGEKVVYSL